MSVLFPSRVPSDAVKGARPLSDFSDRYFRADDKGRASLEAKWKGKFVAVSGEVVIGTLYNTVLREHRVVTIPDTGDYLVLMSGREGEWAASALRDAAAGRKARITGKLVSVDFHRKTVQLDPAEVRLIGRASDDLKFLRGYYRDLETGARKKRGYEGEILAFLAGQRSKEFASFLGEVALRDYPFERLDIPRIKDTSVGVLGRMGELGTAPLVSVIEGYRKRPGMFNRRVFGYAIICLGDVGDKRAWKYAGELERSSGVELSCILRLFERSRDLLPESRWTEILKMADNVLRMEADSTTKRHAQDAMDAYTSGSWGGSPRHEGMGAPAR